MTEPREPSFHALRQKADVPAVLEPSSGEVEVRRPKVCVVEGDHRFRGPFESLGEVFHVERWLGYVEHTGSELVRVKAWRSGSILAY